MAFEPKFLPISQTLVIGFIENDSIAPVIARKDETNCEIETNFKKFTVEYKFISGAKTF